MSSIAELGSRKPSDRFEPFPNPKPRTPPPPSVSTRWTPRSRRAQTRVRNGCANTRRPFGKRLKCAHGSMATTMTAAVLFRCRNAKTRLALFTLKRSITVRILRIDASAADGRPSKSQKMRVFFPPPSSVRFVIVIFYFECYFFSVYDRRF